MNMYENFIEKLNNVVSDLKKLKTAVEELRGGVSFEFRRIDKQLNYAGCLQVNYVNDLGLTKRPTAIFPIQIYAHRLVGYVITPQLMNEAVNLYIRNWYDTELLPIGTDVLIELLIIK